MHPYLMQGLLRERHKDDVLVLKRGSLYHAINRLTRLGLIEAVATDRAGRRPERTTYRLTPAGEEALLAWLREMIATPQREPSAFMASVSFLIHLAPGDAAAQLEGRAARLQAEIEKLGTGVKRIRSFVARINLVELEYMVAMRKAELKWVRGLADEIRSGRLAWDLEKVLRDIRRARRQAAPRKEKG
jgi:DNA-binding PadR family transcriptional regulator